MTDWPAQRRAAAWYIRVVIRLRQAHCRFSSQISRIDNNDQRSMASRLIEIGRRIAMGYEFCDIDPVTGRYFRNWTPEMYRAHLKATRPQIKRGIR